MPTPVSDSKGPEFTAGYQCEGSVWSVWTEKQYWPSRIHSLEIVELDKMRRYHCYIGFRIPSEKFPKQYQKLDTHSSNCNICFLTIHTLAFPVAICATLSRCLHMTSQSIGVCPGARSAPSRTTLLHSHSPIRTHTKLTRSPSCHCAANSHITWQCRSHTPFEMDADEEPMSRYTNHPKYLLPDLALIKIWFFSTQRQKEKGWRTNQQQYQLRYFTKWLPPPSRWPVFLSCHEWI